MITFVNKANADKYSFLYSQASQDLRTHDANGNEVEMGDIDALLGFTKLEGEAALTVDEYEPGRYYLYKDDTYVLCMDAKEDFKADQIYYQSDDITSLDEYFSYIVELNKISKRYTILPLDEEVFEINANTRTIEVPPSFKANGISVQGDEVAEIVYFRINRFFDAMDLTLRDIYIEWKSAAKDENGKEITGVSVPWVVDAESDPGYIIFGWALSSKITQAAGTVTFAVRFYTFDKEKEILEYSLSTLQQTATIKPSLNFDLKNIILDGSLIDNCDALITDRFKNSELSSGAVQAEVPEWVKDLFVPGTDILFDEEAKIVYVNLNDVRDGDNVFKTGAITRDVQAIAPDAGQLSYTWKKYDYDTNQKIDLDFGSEYVLIPETETEKVTGKLYYVPNEGSIGGYSLYQGDSLVRDENYPVSGVYERVSRGVINSIGKYLVICTNRVKNSTVTNETWTLVVPRPVEPIITTQIPERDHLKEGAEYKVQLKVVADKTDAGTLTYQWYHMAPGKSEFEIMEGEVADTLLVTGAAPGEDDSKTGCAGDGHYQVKITNNLNTELPRTVVDAEGNETLVFDRAIDDIMSATCRVTHEAAPLIVNIVGDIAYTVSDIENGKQCAVEPEFPAGSGEPIQRTVEDKITYQWYKYVQGDANADDDRDAANEGNYTISLDRALEGATSPTYQPTVSGWYFCEVTNHYNNTTASKVSRFFNIIDA